MRSTSWVTDRVPFRGTSAPAVLRAPAGAGRLSLAAHSAVHSAGAGRTGLLRILAPAVLVPLGIRAATAGVAFPGPQPGPARSSQAGGVLTLENDVIAGSGKMEAGAPRSVLLDPFEVLVFDAEARI